MGSKRREFTPEYKDEAVKRRHPVLECLHVGSKTQMATAYPQLYQAGTSESALVVPGFQGSGMTHVYRPS